jgi:signal transduction histidine kinase
MKKSNVLASTLMERDHQLKEYRNKTSTMVQELNMVKSLLAQRMEELRTASEDLKLMTEENQVTHTVCALAVCVLL